VLVHGSWHGPWCWDRVRDDLAERGVETFAPALPSTNGDPADLGTFDDDVAAVRAALDESGPAVVCAHSYGGLVVGAATHPAAQHLVFLSAFMADEGEDWAAVAADDGPSPLADSLLADEHGNVLLWPDSAVDIFYGDCDAEDTRHAIGRLGPQNAEPFARTMPAPSWRTVPSTFVICEHDRAISPARQRAMASRAGSTLTVPTSHSAMLSRPDLVAEVLARLAQAQDGA
jgi:pimeloyl-ACP methyl ester carboxylesterase